MALPKKHNSGNIRLKTNPCERDSVTVNLREVRSTGVTHVNARMREPEQSNGQIIIIRHILSVFCTVFSTCCRNAMEVFKYRAFVTRTLFFRIIHSYLALRFYIF